MMQYRHCPEHSSSPKARERRPVGKPTIAAAADPDNVGLCRNFQGRTSLSPWIS
jgi:hypothetical protein